MTARDLPVKPGTADPFSEVDGLLERHFVHLHEGSGLSLDIILERGYTSVLGPKQLTEVGFSRAQARPPGILMPVWGPDGSNGLYVFRPDVPRLDKRDRELKYEIPRRASVRLDVPPRSRSMLADPSIPIWLTEGVKKADALAARGVCAAAILGVWNFKGKNDLGGVTFLADFDYVALNERTVNIVFDSDLVQKWEVRAALERLTEHLQRKGAIVNAVYLPSGPNGAKVGVDDYLLNHSFEEFQTLVSAPRPQPKPAPPLVRLLETSPATINRPLTLIDGHSYAATWVWTEKEHRETTDKHGEVVRHNPPIVSRQRELLIVRDDGKVFGVDVPLSDLDMDIHLPDEVHEEKVWNASGISDYRAGKKPNPADVFRRLTILYDHYLDFRHSLADQQAMCELVACFSLQTWFLPAFTVIGYMWPNGERGSGKSKLGLVWTQTSYLGEMLLASGSFAALRDLADYGAALCFDDAENVHDIKRFDPDKRAIMLAGNRRGATIPLKEALPGGGWKTRRVNAYCPRAFTAINAPDPVIASRSIVIPLARSADSQRANRDPANTDRWPCDRRRLQDDLWALALWLLPEAKAIWGEMEANEGEAGREFEPWRALLSVARLLERHGVEGLEQRLRKLMKAYQDERAELVEDDWTVMVIRALLQFCCDGCDRSDGHDRLDERVTLIPSQVANWVKSIGTQQEVDTEWATPPRVGNILKRLRVGRKERTSSARTRTTTVGEISALSRIYGLSRNSSDENSENVDQPSLPQPVRLVMAVTPVSDSRRDESPTNTLLKPSSDGAIMPCPKCGKWDFREQNGQYVCCVCYPEERPDGH